jgi:hypothetical protein
MNKNKEFALVAIATVAILLVTAALGYPQAALAHDKDDDDDDGGAAAAAAASGDSAAAAAAAGD